MNHKSFAALNYARGHVFKNTSATLHRYAESIDIFITAMFEAGFIVIALALVGGFMWMSYVSNIAANTYYASMLQLIPMLVDSFNKCPWQI